jgi:nucleotide-binding universal stress UspA family protein
MGYRRVVVGTDGSDTATVAVRQAAELTASFGAELVIVTAFEADHALDAARQEAPEELRWRITSVGSAEEKADHARRVASQAGVGKVRLRAEQGDPAQVLIDVAEDVGADCIVVGSKGMASAARFVLGSVPNTVSHHAPCDVLIVHTAS